MNTVVNIILPQGKTMDHLHTVIEHGNYDELEKKVRDIVPCGGGMQFTMIDTGFYKTIDKGNYGTLPTGMALNAHFFSALITTRLDVVSRKRTKTAPFFEITNDKYENITHSTYLDFVGKVKQILPGYKKCILIAENSECGPDVSEANYMNIFSKVDVVILAIFSDLEKQSNVKALVYDIAEKACVKQELGVITHANWEDLKSKTERKKPGFYAHTLENFDPGNGPDMGRDLSSFGDILYDDIDTAKDLYVLMISSGKKNLSNIPNEGPLFISLFNTLEQIDQRLSVLTNMTK